MKASTLTLLHFMYFLDAVHTKAVSLTFHPNRKQFFKYEEIKVTCEGKWSSWPVKKRTDDGKVHLCSAPCSIASAFPSTDSGDYWCDTDVQQTSSSVNIVITPFKIILASPANPVSEGDHVILGCLVLNTRTTGTVTFFKDNLQIYSSVSANLTLNNVSRSDEGLYKCEIPGYGTSAESKLLVRAGTALCQDSSVSVPFLEIIMRRVLLIAFYSLSTIVIVVRFRSRQKEVQPSDDVIVEISS